MPLAFDKYFWFSGSVHICLKTNQNLSAFTRCYNLVCITVQINQLYPLIFEYIIVLNIIISFIIDVLYISVNDITVYNTPW